MNLHTLPITETSSLYSSVLSRDSAYLDYENSHHGDVYTEPLIVNPVDKYQVSNPYADSLWYNARGESGKDSIGEIHNRVVQSKRKYEDDMKPLPPRLDSLSTKKVDSPIKNEKFFAGLDAIKCDSPKYKNLSSTFAETKYRKAFKELFDTELKFASDLSLTESVYLSLLHTKKYKNIISKSQEAIIFSNIATIIELSTLFTNEVKKSVSKVSNGSLNNDLSAYFNFCKVEKVDIGDILNTQISRFRIVYASYSQRHEAQISTLRSCIKTGGPKIKKWLDECSYLAKSRSDCWNLESLLIKPIQRISKYSLLIDALLKSSETEIPIEFIEHLYDCKKSLETLLRDLDKSVAASIDSTEAIYSELKPSALAKTEYKPLVRSFKTHHQNLQLLKTEVNLSLKPLLQFVEFQKKLGQRWKKFMEYDDVDAQSDDRFIKSIYSSYLDRVEIQQENVKLLICEYEEKVGKALDMALEYCASVKKKLTLHNSYKGAYVHYLKYGDKSTNHSVSHSLKHAQDYVVIGNEIKDELPIMLTKLEHFEHNIALIYSSLTLKWFQIIGGSAQIKQYQELLTSGELIMSDNFDLIELYSLAKHNTSLALKDMCVKSVAYRSPMSGSTASSSEIRISASKVVRTLFGV